MLQAVLLGRGLSPLAASSPRPDRLMESVVISASDRLAGIHPSQTWLAADRLCSTPSGTDANSRAHSATRCHARSAPQPLPDLGQTPRRRWSFNTAFVRPT